MARIHSIGFELNSATTGVECTTYGSPTITNSVIHDGATPHGSYALSVRTATNVSCYALHSFTAVSSNTWGTAPIRYFRTYFQYHTLPSGVFITAFSNNDVDIMSASNCLWVTIDGTGHLRLYDNTLTVIGSPSSALTADTWYRIELAYCNQEFLHLQELRVNGTVIATSSTASTGMDAGDLTMGMRNSAAKVQFYYDDAAINDTAGSSQTGYPGEEYIVHLHPDSAGDANAWEIRAGGTAGAANNYTRVLEETPDDLTTYNGSLTLNNEDLYNCGACGIDTSVYQINVVHVGNRHRKSSATAGGPSMKLEIEKTASGTKTQSVAVTPTSTTWETNFTTSYKNYLITTYADPDGAAWNSTTLDSMQIGMKITTGHASRSIHVSTIWACVCFSLITSSVKDLIAPGFIPFAR